MTAQTLESGEGRMVPPRYTNNMALHRSLMECAQCGESFKPRVKHGSNADRFCCLKCKDEFWNKRRAEQRGTAPPSTTGPTRSPPAAATDTVGEITKPTDPNHTLPAPTALRRRRETKISRILRILVSGRSLNRFEAERVGDHCLHSTVSAIERRFSVTVNRRDEMVPGYGGRSARVCRYWLEPREREKGLKALEFNI